VLLLLLLLLALLLGFLGHQVLHAEKNDDKDSGHGQDGAHVLTAALLIRIFYFCQEYFL
jgi:hypothetical protein